MLGFGAGTAASCVEVLIDSTPTFQWQATASAVARQPFLVPAAKSCRSAYDTTRGVATSLRHRQPPPWTVMTVYTAAQAATVCQVSLRTVQRKTLQLEAAGAWKDATGQWRIPVDAMRAVGLSPGRPAAPDKAGDKPLRQPATTPDTVSQLRAEVAQWRRRAEIAEAQAAERERIIETQQMALRMLNAPTTGAAALERSPAVPRPPAGFLARLLKAFS